MTARLIFDGYLWIRLNTEVPDEAHATANVTSKWFSISRVSVLTSLL